MVRPRVEPRPRFLLVHDNRTVAGAHHDAADTAGIDARLEAECDREAALRLIREGEKDGALPDVIIVDLCASAGASEAFLVEARQLAPGGHPLIVAFTEDFSGPSRRRLLEAGADAVFERARRPDDFVREIDALHRYWRRMAAKTGV